MSDLNSVVLYGRVVRDAGIKTAASGLKIAEFSIAVNRTYRDETGAYVQRGHFFPLALYGDYAEKMQLHLKRGQRVIVEGYLKQEKWEQDGITRSATAIGVDRIHLIFDAKPRDATPSPAAPQVTDYATSTQQLATAAAAADDAANAAGATAAVAGTSGIADMSDTELQELYDAEPSDELYDNGRAYDGNLAYGGDIF